MQFDPCICQECNKQFDAPGQIRRHIREHGVTFEQYWLKWKHGGVRPICWCGCGGQPAWNVALKDYASYVHGHHMTGRHVTDETRRKIGEKNAINMKRFMSEHPDVARSRIESMSTAYNDEVEARRIETVRATYAALSDDDRQKFSSHAKRLWQDGTLRTAHDKAMRTWKMRHAAGEYDFTERNERISQAVTKLYLEGGFKWARGLYVSSKTGKQMHYRSSWELEFARLLDQDSDVLDWCYEPLAIPYEHDGIVRQYIPDFFVQTSNTPEFVLIEVKPQSLQSVGVNVMKTVAAQALCDEMGWMYRTWQPTDGCKWLTI
jgi:hypothetical protein